MKFRSRREVFILVCLFFAATPGAIDAQTTTADDRSGKRLAWPGKKSVWNGFDRFDFTVDSRPAYVVVPKTPAVGRPWVWRARFPGYHDEIDLILVKAGFHIGRIDTDGMLGSPRAMRHWDAFYAFVTEHGLSRRPALEGVSRGGLFVYGFASRWPQRVACIYCDTPVGDIRSWPGGKGSGRGDAATWKACLQEYGLTEQSAEGFTGSPIDNLAPIAKAGIPLLHIISMNDTVVPPSENTLLLAERYRELGGSIEVIKIKTGTEQSHGHHFALPDPQRMADFMIRHSTNEL